MAYDYIKRTYSFEPRVGAEVRHTETDRFGVICRENRSQGNYVQVRFGDDRHALPCHPMSLEYVAEVSP